MLFSDNHHLPFLSELLGEDDDCHLKIPNAKCMNRQMHGNIDTHVQTTIHKYQRSLHHCNFNAWYKAEQAIVVIYDVLQNIDRGCFPCSQWAHSDGKTQWFSVDYILSNKVFLFIRPNLCHSQKYRGIYIGLWVD